MVTRLEEARAVAETVVDPELPMMTLADLGVLRDVSEMDDRIIVTITPTYSGCPAMDAMCGDLVAVLRAAGYPDAEVRVVLHPPWTTDWISDRGRRKLSEAGIAPPHTVPARLPGPVPLTLIPSRKGTVCPRCGSLHTEQLSHFGPTACTALHRCHACQEPFEYLKEI